MLGVYSWLFLMDPNNKPSILFLFLVCLFFCLFVFLLFLCESNSNLLTQSQRALSSSMLIQGTQPGNLFASIQCRLFPAPIMWWATSGVLYEINYPATIPCSPTSPLQRKRPRLEWYGKIWMRLVFTCSAPARTKKKTLRLDFATVVDNW